MLVSLLLALSVSQSGADLIGDAPMLVSPGTIAEGEARPRGARILVRQAGENAYSAQVFSPTLRLPLKQGHVVYVSYRARALSAKTESSTGSWSVHFQRSVAPFDGPGSSSGNAGRAWRTFHHAFLVDKDYAADAMQLAFHVASLPQELEFDSLKALDLGPNVDMKKLPFTELTYLGREANAPWRKKAAAMIEKHRKGDLVVRVTRGGKPVAGATVRARLTRHDYPFGTFTEYHIFDRKPDSERFMKVLASALFSRVTVPIYWADWGWVSNRAGYLATIKWCMDRGIRMKAHNVLWPSYKWSPTKLKDMDNATLRRTILEDLDSRLAELRAFPFENVDVLNEIRSEHEFADKLGFDLYVEVFKRSKAAWPKAALVYNDYSVFEGSRPGGPATDASERLAKQLRSAGAPVTMLGWQGHFGEDLTPPEEVWRMIERFQKSVGLPLEITEFDIDTRDEQAQADYTRDLMTAWFAHPATRGFTLWGFWEGSHWKPNGAMFRRDWSPKPMAKAWETLMTKTWTTDATVKTDARGMARIRGFKGDYSVSAGKATAKAKLGSSVTVNLGL